MTQPECKTITKKELVNRIAERTGQTKVVVKEILQHFLDEIIEELAVGNRLEFREFGVFEVRERAARKAQNPRTLEKVYVPAKRVVKFKVGRTMRERVCDERPPRTATAVGPGRRVAQGNPEPETADAAQAAAVGPELAVLGAVTGSRGDGGLLAPRGMGVDGFAGEEPLKGRRGTGATGGSCPEGDEVDGLAGEEPLKGQRGTEATDGSCPRARSPSPGEGEG